MSGRASWICLCVMLLGGVVPLARVQVEASPGRSRVVTDQTGHAVPVPLPFRGAVPLFQGVGEYTVVTRDPSSILDSQTVSLAWLAHSLLLRVYPQLRDVRHDLSVLDQQTANEERLLLLDPSAIFIWQGVTPQLRQVGLPALAMVQIASLSDVIEHARLFADASGQPDRARELVTASKAAIQRTRDTLGAIPMQERYTVAELFVAPTGLVTNTGFGADRDALAAAGLRDIWADRRRALLNAESLLRLDPDIILLLQAPTPSPVAFRTNPRWRSLKAVQTAAVYRRLSGLTGGFPDIVDFPLFTRWLAELAHPDRLAPELRADIRQTARRQLGYSMTDAEIGTFVDAAENASAKGYTRFVADQTR